MLPAVKESNQNLKDYFGKIIVDYIEEMEGLVKVPKITEMPIELPIPQIYTNSYANLQMKV